jgi:hypothetical protein
MNKGIAMTDSIRVLFLKSGYTVSNIDKFIEFIKFRPDLDLDYADVIKVKPDGSEIIMKYPNELSLDYMICFGLPQQATIINKSLFKKIGLYNESYKIISDWVFFMEAVFIHNATYKHIDLPVINFDGSGISNQSRYVKTIIKEQLDYITKRFPDKIPLYKSQSPYVKKYFRTIPRWKRFIIKYIFMKFNYI